MVIAFTGLLLATVALVPYRYLVLPDFIPGFFQSLVHYAPAFLSVLLVLSWGWWRRDTLRETLSALPLCIPVAVLFLAGVMSSLGAEKPLLSLSKTVYYFLTGGLLFVVVADLCASIKRPQIGLYLFVFTAYLVALYGIVEFVVGRNPVYHGVFSVENEMYLRLIPDPWFGRRVVSTIGHPVVLGAYLVLVIPLSLSLLFNARQRLLQAVFLLGSGSLLGALGLTFSRGAWLAVLVGLGVYLKLRKTRHLLLLPLVLGLALVAVLGLSEDLAQIVMERLQDAYENYILDFASTTRGQSYGHVAAITGANPLMGLGTGMYRFAAYDLRRTMEIPTPLGVLDTPDNMYLMWLAENGALGLGAGAFFLASLFGLLRRAIQVENDADRKELARAFIAAFAGFCVDMLTCDALYFHVTRVVFWMVAGVAVALLVRTGDEQAENDGSGQAVDLGR